MGTQLNSLYRSVGAVRSKTMPLSKAYLVYLLDLVHTNSSIRPTTLRESLLIRLLSVLCRIGTTFSLLWF